MVSYKNKKTGVIYTQLSRSMGSDGCRISLGTNAEAVIELTEEEVKRDFEIINIVPEYEKVWGAIKRFGERDSDVQRLFEAFLRRAQPNYYNEGDVVILVNLPGGISSEIDRAYLLDHLNLRSVPFRVGRITDLYDEYRGLVGSKLSLTRQLSKKDEFVEFLSLPMYSDRIVKGDAFYCVRRLDMPY